MKEIAVIHALKLFRVGSDHLDGTVAVFNAHQETILDDAMRFNKRAGQDGARNYEVVAIVLLQYERDDASVWTDVPIKELYRWSNNGPD
jgi:hypothetical protein